MRLRTQKFVENLNSFLRLTYRDLSHESSDVRVPFLFLYFFEKFNIACFMKRKSSIKRAQRGAHLVVYSNETKAEVTGEGERAPIHRPKLPLTVLCFHTLNLPTKISNLTGEGAPICLCLKLLRIGHQLLCSVQKVTCNWDENVVVCFKLITLGRMCLKQHNLLPYCYVVGLGYHCLGILVLRKFFSQCWVLRRTQL